MQPGSAAALFALSFLFCPAIVACSATADPVDSTGLGDDEDEDWGTGGGGTAPPSCTYPSGAYGVQLGAIANPSLSWQGYPDNRTDPASIEVGSYLDCDGTKGINALLVIQSATWCGACQEEAAELGAKVANGWGAKGIHVLTLMIENGSSQPATIDTALAWKDQFKLETAVAADPGMSFVGQGSGEIGLPVEVVLDPRTMTIVDRQEGYSGYYPSLEQLAAKNAGP